MTFFLKPEQIAPELTSEEKKQHLEESIIKYFYDPYIVWNPTEIDATCLVYNPVLKKIEEEKGMMKYKFTVSEWVTEIFLFKEVDKSEIQNVKDYYANHNFCKYIKKRFVYSTIEELDNLIFLWDKKA